MCKPNNITWWQWWNRQDERRININLQRFDIKKSSKFEKFIVRSKSEFTQDQE